MVLKCALPHRVRKSLPPFSIPKTWHKKMSNQFPLFHLKSPSKRFEMSSNRQFHFAFSSRIYLISSPHPLLDTVHLARTRPQPFCPVKNHPFDHHYNRIARFEKIGSIHLQCVLWTFRTNEMILLTAKTKVWKRQKLPQNWALFKLAVRLLFAANKCDLKVCQRSYDCFWFTFIYRERF